MEITTEQRDALRRFKENLAAAHEAGLWDLVQGYCAHADSINDTIDAVDALAKENNID